jgi:hypothetical protein
MSKQIVALVCALLGSAHLSFGQQPPKSPLVRAFGDNQFWMLAEDMRWTIGKTSDTIIVPKGFVTDFASIPKGLWSLGLAPNGQYTRAATIHDYLYWSQGCTKAQSDRLLLIAMKESNVGRFNETIVYQGVDKGGGAAWNKNAADRKAGLLRIVPDQYLHPDDPNIHWPEYRSMLARLSLVEPPFEQHPKYCSYGDTTDVP